MSRLCRVLTRSTALVVGFPLMPVLAVIYGAWVGLSAGWRAVSGAPLPRHHFRKRGAR
jgi:hypothetical protein